MPYVRVKEDPICPMLRAADLNSVRLAKVLGCTRPTALRRIRDPGSLTVAELRSISRKAHVPIETIRDAL